MKTNIVRGIVLLMAITILVIGGLYVKDRWYTKDALEVITINKSNYIHAVFWEVVKAGMGEAVEAYEIDMIYMQPQYEHQIEEQKAVIESAIEMKPDVIILVASDYYEISPYAEKILDSGIKLLLMDSNVYTPNYSEVPFVGTNSLKAGAYLGELADQHSQVDDKALLLVHYYGVQTSDDREAGIRAGFGNERIVNTYSCNSDEEIAYEKTKEALTSGEGINIVLATNENVTIGAAKAIDELGLGEIVSLYGFDGSQRHVVYLEKGIIDYTVIQSPYQIGYLAVVNAIKLGENKEVTHFIETDFLPISKDNMYDVGYREILFPFIATEP